ncbi:MAG: hypothetical protein R2734_15800 [Nocardioides sp.]
MMVLNFAIPVPPRPCSACPGGSPASSSSTRCWSGSGQGLVVRGLTGRLRWRVLVAAQLVFAVSWVLLLAAASLPVAAAVAVVLVAAVVLHGRGAAGWAESRSAAGGRGRPPARPLSGTDPAGVERRRRHRRWASPGCSTVARCPSWPALFAMSAVAVLTSVRWCVVLPRAAGLTNRAEPART